MVNALVSGEDQLEILGSSPRLVVLDVLSGK